MPWRNGWYSSPCVPGLRTGASVIASCSGSPSKAGTDIIAGQAAARALRVQQIRGAGPQPLAYAAQGRIGQVDPVHGIAKIRQWITGGLGRRVIILDTGRITRRQDIQRNDVVCSRGDHSGEGTRQCGGGPVGEPAGFKSACCTRYPSRGRQSGDHRRFLASGSGLDLRQTGGDPDQGLHHLGGLACLLLRVGLEGLEIDPQGRALGPGTR